MLPKTVENTGDKLKCEACGKEFFCGVETGKCWCFEIDLDEAALTDLRENYRNCLCEDCLSLRRPKK